MNDKLRKEVRESFSSFKLVYPDQKDGEEIEEIKGSCANMHTLKIIKHGIGVDRVDLK